MRAWTWIALAACFVGCQATAPTTEEITSEAEQDLLANECVVCCRAQTGGGREFGQCMRQAAKNQGPCAGCRGAEVDAGGDAATDTGTDAAADGGAALSTAP